MTLLYPFLIDTPISKDIIGYIFFLVANWLSFNLVKFRKPQTGCKPGNTETFA